MNGIPKPNSLNDIKFLINNFEGALSEENIKVFTTIIDKIESAGGINHANPKELEELICLLAEQNDIDLSEL
ncbi:MULTISPECIES: hypothetical protein [unclassified Candidatus Frackibacter]|uniref:hypothetical protein n=1 Tax=unclassified Candidatus Frackibacter TaxID=2648818 RepID=UPI000795BF20|nr:MULTISPECIES: hypothetical protein [unclassified Candidatus Frackibacter]KXS45101.1 MAG: hypothetical protein AWU54_610 [Candidatus Frackibacter sp. T328-2]SDB96395.1 hypothetical protein SAMN04515661_10118 [Candidatus Frackibacter sp. WG11]SEM27849.1 hypothetical protein SAMN04488698_10119 [Candidatus Frackibacter sp. WG12]SFL32640.1 hypothetical protein SAMN04488699_10119 [Candidatus Frackibacter sp. WG13]